MEATYTELVKFLSGETICTIPVYQRNYDWKKAHCEQLFADLERLINNEKPEHFIGTVVYQKKVSGAFTEQIIIDGQQRITSVILLAKAVYDLSNDKKLRERIFTAFIKSFEDDTEFKLKPSEFDRKIFEKLMNGENFSPKEFSRLYLNYKFFKEKIAASKYDFTTIHNAIKNLKIVALKLDNENPQEIFESLNSTGKDLTETELIRNYLLINLDTDAQEKLYKKYWLPIEKMLHDSDTFETFMVQFLVSMRKSSKHTYGGKNIQISKYALYPAFRKYFEKNYSGNKNEKVEDFLADMYNYAEFYGRLIAIENEDFENLSALEKKFYELIYKVGSSSSAIILMDLHKKYENFIFDEKTFIQIVDALISLMFRAKICRQTGVDTSQKAGNILKYFEESGKFNVDSFWEAIADGNGKYTLPNDSQFTEALKNPDLGLSFKGENIKYIKYLLYSFERNINHSNNFSDYENLYVEFVIPQKITTAWKKYLQDQGDSQAEKFIYSLGNLVLNTDDKNKKALFGDKKIIYATSKFMYTKDLAKFLKWSSIQIHQRAEHLAKLALKIWSVPEKYNPVVTFIPDIFNLNSDFRIFTNTAPATLTISDKEYTINYWIDLLRRVAQELYNCDKDIFKYSVLDDRIYKIFSTTPENLSVPYQIDENFYIGSGIDTRKCLRFTKIIVENFDSLSVTNFKDEIWFTLKNS